MSDLDEFWKTYHNLIFQELTAVIFIEFGMIVFTIGWIIPSITSQEIPVLSRAFDVFTALGITLMFFGLTLIYEFYKDFKDDQETLKIQESLARIETKLGCNIPSSGLVKPTTALPNVVGTTPQKNTKPHSALTDKPIYFTLVLIMMILEFFTYFMGNYSLTIILLVVAIILMIIHYSCSK